MTYEKAASLSATASGSVTAARAKQRLSAGRARDHPVMEIVPNKALSLSLSLSLSLTPYPTASKALPEQSPSLALKTKE